MKPISPNDVVAQKLKQIPDQVIQAFNELIAKKWNGSKAVIEQDEVIAKIIAIFFGTITRQEIFDNHWLDVEGVYESEGWKVYYDKPGYCETYSAYFEFTKK